MHHVVFFIYLISIFVHPVPDHPYDHAPASVFDVPSCQSRVLRPLSCPEFCNTTQSVHYNQS